MSDRAGDGCVDLVVNCYERTYRDVLAPGRFESIEADCSRRFAHRWAVINNVKDRGDARRRAETLIDQNELSGFVFVSDVIDDALARIGLSRRNLGARPYFMDYAAVMVTTGQSEFVLGWDAEVRLEEPADWVEPGLRLLQKRSDVFTVSPRWPAREWDSLAAETISTDGEFALTWGFSDQIWLNRRADLIAPIYRTVTPASLGRHAAHPFTFESRVEAYQRRARRFKAVHTGVRYTHNDLPPVLDRIDDRRWWEIARARALSRTYKALRRVGSQHPSLRVP